MPDRIIRDELLESQAWLTLKDNADRLAFIALLLKADSLGDFPAAPFRLMRLWRDFGIFTPELVAKTLNELADHGLIMLYEAGGSRFLHIPKFGQRLRHLTRVFPVSPWATEQQKQAITNKTPASSLTRASLAPAEVKRSEVKRGEERKTLSGAPKNLAHTDAVELLEFLNQKTGRRFRPTTTTLKPILARLKEYSFDECRGVIVRRWVAWRNDDKMREYLRPSTLFNATNFAQYVGDVPMQNEEDK